MNQQHDPEAYDVGTGMQMRIQNESGSYNDFVRWERGLKEDKTVRGRLKLILYWIWKLLFKLEPFWQIFVVSVTGNGVQFASSKLQPNPDIAFFVGCQASVLMGIVLFFIWKAGYYYGYV